ncbi:phage integrase central domain-containing protein [Vibrio sp. ER1A]|uniref:phage integrase central domain-containing protein n=1 Tax=Vibrio sp. ER1A TaxID=1517681 RepID=UPI0004DD22BE|nr:tyrosine-type recombinase/integrase [Vibrio sp. ER1A]KFA98754.1 integrase [Vibrio sp. ER1A]
MPRPRSKKYRDLPEGLYFKGKKGYVFRRIDDSWKSLGHDKARAISLARRYNATYRVEEPLAHEESFFSKSSHTKTARGSEKLSTFFERVAKRYLEDEKPAESTYELFMMRLNRLNELLGNHTGSSISLEIVNQVLDECARNQSNEVYNRWIAFMSKVFDYAVDESVMLDNPAKRKKRKPLPPKQRQRLSLTEYKKIWLAAPTWMKTAMSLALETTHSVNEVCNLKYKDFERLVTPLSENGLEIFGYLKIHRQKVQKHEASRVRIPVTASLLKIIEDSRDNIASPYIVHRLPARCSNESRRHCDHHTQVNKKYLSTKFTELRDSVGIKAVLPARARPTFHEIRGLSIHLYDKAGYDPQARAAHTDARSTEVYKEGHVIWTTVPAAQLNIS